MWKFRELTKNDTLTNASHLEFFRDEALSSTVDALAREDIQNRLDARAKDAEQVEVRYRFCGPNAQLTGNRWFACLNEHLTAEKVEIELGTKPSLENARNWLVIEDFHTNGLEGDPECFRDPPSDSTEPRNDFYWFIRNVGRSGKKGSDRGRWGLGKIVYPATSKIRSFFAYSVRRSDKKRGLIGRSVLAVHDVGDLQHDSEGYYGEYNDPENKYFATPFENEKTLEDFKQQFSIQREDNQPGLSLVIPAPEDDITPPALIQSLIEHWFQVFIEGRLTVRVHVPSWNEEVVINKSTIEEVVRTYIGDDTLSGVMLLKKIRFAYEVEEFDLKSENYFSLNLSEPNKAPRWQDIETKFPSEEHLEKAREFYHRGDLVGFEVPICVKPARQGIGEVSSFEVYIQRTDSTTPAAETFLRDGLTISGVKNLREHGVLALVKIEDNSLGTLLGDAENPAHTRWDSKGKHFKNRYQYGPSILSYVKQSAKSISATLARRADGIHKDLLKNYFSIPEEGNGKTPTPGKPKPGGTTPPPFKEKVPQKFYIESTKLHGGFRIKPHQKATSTPHRIVIRTAYDVARGNPFKLHHAADFDFTNNSVEIEEHGLMLIESSKNRLEYEVKENDFELAVTGFDTNRDLIVNARVFHSNSSEEGETES